jgi:all-trans-retinol 13,14-reductase
MVLGLARAIVDWAMANPAVVGVGLLLYVFIFFLSLFFQVPKPGPNPFKRDCRKKPEELVTDQKARDKVLKQGFSEKRIPDTLDAIIIGSGIGGLTAGVILAKAGKKVLVLEQHDQAGGCCHTFIDKGYEFDVGIHYIGEMRNNTVTRLLVEQITEGQLQWVDLIDEFDVVALGEPGKQQFYPFVAGGREAWKKGMLKHFPNEEEVLDKYLELLKDVRMNMLGMVMLKLKSKWFCRLLINTGLIHRVTKYFFYSKKTVQEVLDELTDNEDLKAVLSYSFGDYGTVPSKGSFAMHAALINHYLFGASYPRGGASEIGFHMIPIIERAGGRVLVRAPVSSIVTEDGKAVGVRVAKSSGEVEIRAPLVISDAGVVNTFKTLLPKEVAAQSSIDRLIHKQVDSGVGALTLYVGLKGTGDELNIKPQNIWAFTGNKLSEITEEYFEKSADEAVESNVPLLFISFPSSKDPTFNERYPGKTACTVVTLARWEWFSEWEAERVGKRGDEYNTIKMAIGKQIWNQVLAIYPQLEDKVEYFDVGSPITNKYYINAPKGEIYGLDHTAKRFGSPDIMMTLRPETEIPGLLLTGQDVLSCGFTGAMMGGVLAASKVLNRNLWDDLVNLKKKVNKTK